MDMPVSVDRLPPDVHPADGKPAAALADDLVVVRRRLRHLAPLDIRPLPMMHAVVGASADAPPPAQRERTQELALHLLAIHMWQAAARSALS
ncbi:MAG: hypothetical protein KGJ66_09420 [Alphaproteobacteria bacterium]|nr:hypothetical protein [Alphaproteobacteria bacterium]